MRFGVFSNGQRIRQSGLSYDHDIHEMVTADRVGFEEVWISEHSGQRLLPHAVPAVELLIAKAAALTERIKFGPAVRRIALYPPQMVAIEGAMCDQLTHGRYMFGFGVGPRLSFYPQWGLDEREAEERTFEALDLILKCWRAEEKFDFAGAYYRGTDIDIYPKPVQSNMSIAVATLRASMLERAAKDGFRILSTWTAMAENLRKGAEMFDGFCRQHHGAPRRKDWICARAVWVADTDEKALRQAEADWRHHLSFGKNHEVSATFLRPGGGKVGLTFEEAIAAGNIIIGSPRTVTEMLTRFYEDIGGFGTLLIVGGRDIGTVEERDAMFHLFAEAVMPKLAPLDPDTPATLPRALAGVG